MKISPSLIQKIMKIIIPSGVIEPNETAVITIPQHLLNRNVLRAVRSRREVQFDSTADESSLGTLGPGYFDSTADSNSLGILGSGYMDSTQDSSSFGVLGSGYFDTTQTSGEGLFESTRSSNSTPPRRVVKKTSKTTIKRPAATSTPISRGNSRVAGGCPASSSGSAGILGPGYFDTTAESSGSAGILGSGYFDSTQPSSGSMGMLGSGYFDTTQESSGSMGILGPGYMDSTRSSGGCGGGRDSELDDVSDFLKQLEDMEYQSILA